MHARRAAIIGWLSIGCSPEPATETQTIPTSTAVASVTTTASTSSAVPSAQPVQPANPPTGTGSTLAPSVTPTTVSSGNQGSSSGATPEPAGESSGIDVESLTASGSSSSDPQPTTVGGSDGSSSGDSASGTGAESNVETPEDDTNRPMTIWIAGDSTVANGNTPCPTGWGKHLAQLFNEHVTIRNSAAGGRSVRTWMYNVQTDMGPDGECLLEQSPSGEPTVQARWQEMLDGMMTGDALLIQFGINDGSPTCDRHVGLNAFKETYAVMIAAAKERGVTPVLITPVSAISCSGSNPQGTRGGYVDATIEAAQAADVPVLDLHARSVARYAELGFCPVAGGDVSASTGGAVGEYFCDDHTHFSASGALDIASLVVELMHDAGVPFISHVK